MKKFLLTIIFTLAAATCFADQGIVVAVDIIPSHFEFVNGEPVTFPNTFLIRVRTSTKNSWYIVSEKEWYNINIGDVVEVDDYKKGKCHEK